MQQTMNELRGFKDIYIIGADRMWVGLAVFAGLLLSAWVASQLVVAPLHPQILL